MIANLDSVGMVVMLYPLTDFDCDIQYFQGKRYTFTHVDDICSFASLPRGPTLTPESLKTRCLNNVSHIAS